MKELPKALAELDSRLPRLQEVLTHSTHTSSPAIMSSLEADIAAAEALLQEIQASSERKSISKSVSQAVSTFVGSGANKRLSTIERLNARLDTVLSDLNSLHHAKSAQTSRALLHEQKVTNALLSSMVLNSSQEMARLQSVQDDDPVSSEPESTASSPTHHQLSLMTGHSTANMLLLQKLLLVGDSGVGKSCLLMRYASDSFNQHRPATIGVECTTHIWEARDHRVKLQLWDAAGQESFTRVIGAYSRDQDAVIVVFDVTRRETFNSIPRWLQFIEEHAPRCVTVAVCGTKTDLEGHQVSKEDVLSLVECYKGPSGLIIDPKLVFFTSAMWDSNCKETFQSVSRTLAARNFQATIGRLARDGVEPSQLVTELKKRGFHRRAVPQYLDMDDSKNFPLLLRTGFMNSWRAFRITLSDEALFLHHPPRHDKSFSNQTTLVLTLTLKRAILLPRLMEADPDFAIRDLCFVVAHSKGVFKFSANTLENHSSLCVQLANAITRLSAGRLDESAASKLLAYQPVWQPDSSSTVCTVCLQPFTVLRRRHHCRICGCLGCGGCICKLNGSRVCFGCLSKL